MADIDLSTINLDTLQTDLDTERRRRAASADRLTFDTAIENGTLVAIACEECHGFGKTECSSMGSDNMDIDEWTEDCDQCTGGVDYAVTPAGRDHYGKLNSLALKFRREK